MSNNIIEQTKARLILAATEDDGMSTAEYAIGTIAAAAFGAVLYTVVTGSPIVDALTGIICRAIGTAGRCSPTTGGVRWRRRSRLLR